MPKDEQAQERTDFGMSKVVYIIVPIEYVIAERDIFNLTLSQTTNFRHFQTERVCRRQFQAY